MNITADGMTDSGTDCLIGLVECGSTGLYKPKVLQGDRIKYSMQAIYNHFKEDKQNIQRKNR